MLDVKIVNGL